MGYKAKLLNYDFVKECVDKSSFSIQTPQGEITWKNTNEFKYKTLMHLPFSLVKMPGAFALGSKKKIFLSLG